jgi:hypothetical protein
MRAESLYTEGNHVLLDQADLQFPAHGRRVIRDLENDRSMRFVRSGVSTQPRPRADVNGVLPLRRSNRYAVPPRLADVGADLRTRTDPSRRISP